MLDYKINNQAFFSQNVIYTERFFLRKLKIKNLQTTENQIVVS
jgi:hypothetical protein